MGEVIRFIPKSERERARLVREARARYDSIFPPADLAREQPDKTPVSHTVNDSKCQSQRRESRVVIKISDFNIAEVQPPLLTAAASLNVD